MTVFWAMDMMAKHPKFQEKAIQEVHSVLGHIQDWNSPSTIVFLENIKVSDFPFLECILQETMRLRPVGTAFYATNYSKVELYGYEIPAESNLVLLPRVGGITSFPIAENDSLPTDFDPERWTSENNNADDGDGDIDYTSSKQLKDSLGKSKRLELLSQSTSFGAGPRICPGRFLAMQEMILILSVAILSEYRVEHFPKPIGHENIEEDTLFVNTPNNLDFLLRKIK